MVLYMDEYILTTMTHIELRTFPYYQHDSHHDKAKKLYDMLFSDIHIDTTKPVLWGWQHITLSELLGTITCSGSYRDNAYIIVRKSDCTFYHVHEYYNWSDVIFFSDPFYADRPDDLKILREIYTDVVNSVIHENGCLRQCIYQIADRSKIIMSGFYSDLKEIVDVAKKFGIII